MKKLLALFIAVCFITTGILSYTVFAQQNSEESKLREAIMKLDYENQDGIKGIQLVEKDNSEVSTDTQRNPAVIAVYFVPGIGEVALLATGAITVAGITYYAGSWIYDKVMDWIHKWQADYDDAKDKGEPTNNHEEVEGRNLPREGDKPYSSKDLKTEDGIKQRRYYGKDKEAEMDIDYFHEDNDGSHVFPHRHDWVNGVREKRWYVK